MCSLSGVMTLIPACWAKAAHEIIVSSAIKLMVRERHSLRIPSQRHSIFPQPERALQNGLLVDAAIMSSRGHSRARKIWIDDALGGAARCRRVALRQRRVAAFVIVGPPVVHMQANRISRIVRLSPSRRRRQNRRERQNRQSRNAHQSLLWDMRGATHR